MLLNVLHVRIQSIARVQVVVVISRRHRSSVVDHPFADAHLNRFVWHTVVIDHGQNIILLEGLTEGESSLGKITTEPPQQSLEVLQIMLLSHDPPSLHAGTEPSCVIETGGVPPLSVHANSIKIN